MCLHRTVEGSAKQRPQRAARAHAEQRHAPPPQLLAHMVWVPAHRPQPCRMQVALSSGLPMSTAARPQTPWCTLPTAPSHTWFHVIQTAATTAARPHGSGVGLSPRALSHAFAHVVRTPHHRSCSAVQSWALAHIPRQLPHERCVQKVCHHEQDSHLLSCVSHRSDAHSSPISFPIRVGMLLGCPLPQLAPTQFRCQLPYKIPVLWTNQQTGVGMLVPNEVTQKQKAWTRVRQALACVARLYQESALVASLAAAALHWRSRRHAAACQPLLL